MRYLQSLTVIATTSLGITGCVSTSSDGVAEYHLSRVAVSGERTLVEKAWHLNPDCSPAETPTIRLEEPPKHGHVEIVDQKVVAAPTGVFKKCGTPRIDGATGYYTSAPGFRGHDQMKVRISFENGHIVDDAYDINVVK